MDPVLYTGLSSARTDFNREAITANNMANVNTPGFKADLYNAETMYMSGSSNFKGQGFTVEKPNKTDFTAGAIMTTGRELDIAVDGNGWFAVQDSKGKEAYTRAGNLRIDKTGVLICGSGRPILGDGGPISIPPADHVDIGTDGTISIVPAGAKPTEMVVLDRIKLVTVNNANLYKDKDGLMKLSSGKATADASLGVISGALEGSNVNPIDQMVQMISSGREFEASLKLMQSIDENYSKLAQVLHE